MKKTILLLYLLAVLASGVFFGIQSAQACMNNSCPGAERWTYCKGNDGCSPYYDYCQASECTQDPWYCDYCMSASACQCPAYTCCSPY
jgi:hypothetical protein